MTEPLFELTLDELSAVASTSSDAVHLKLTGTADINVDPSLALIFSRVDDEAVRVNIPEVRVDLSGLEFMNSSCFKRLITWILSVRRRPREQGYRIHLCVDPAQYWQRRSLQAISFFGGDLVVIDERAP